MERKVAVGYNDADLIMVQEKMNKLGILWRTMNHFVDEDTQLAILEEWQKGNLDLCLPEEVVRTIDLNYR